MPDPSRVCDLYHSLWPCQVLNPLNETRGQTCSLMDTSWVLNPLSHCGNFSLSHLKTSPDQPSPDQVEVFGSERPRGPLLLSKCTRGLLLGGCRGWRGRPWAKARGSAAWGALGDVRLSASEGWADRRMYFTVKALCSHQRRSRNVMQWYFSGSLGAHAASVQASPSPSSPWVFLLNFPSPPLFFHFRAAPEAYGGFQARGWMWAIASLHHSHSNARSLTYWARPGFEPTSSWILVGFITHWARRGLTSVQLSTLNNFIKVRLTYRQL